jgi:hypothetical protein
MMKLREYARHRAAKGLPGQTLAAVQKALGTGRIQANDGGIDPAAADRAWLANTNVIQQQRSRRPPAPEASDFDRGAAWLAERLAANFRTVWPAFIAKEPGLTPKALLVALLPYLAETWLEEYLDPSQLPAINWKVFGKDAAAVRVECEALRTEWLSTPAATSGH